MKPSDQDTIRTAVRERYGEIARSPSACGCSSAGCCSAPNTGEARKPDQAARPSLNGHANELIAIGTSVGVHCQPCLKFHVAKAKKMGISDDEIREAIAVGHMVEKGASSAMREFSNGVLENA